MEMEYIHILNLSTRIEWKRLIQIMNEWWIVESFSLFSFHSSTKQIWYSSIDWFIEYDGYWKWMIIDIMKIRVDDMVNLKWLMNVLINVNMNGMVINSSTNEKNDSMNWWILYSNDVIWNIIDWLLWYIVTYYLLICLMNE